MITHAWKFAGLAAFALALAGCESYVQTTSGEEYLSRYEALVGLPRSETIDPAIARAANVEPTLVFPARIGLARIDNGFLSPVPQGEAEAWMAMADDLGPDWGEFVPISPLMVALANPNADTRRDCPEYSWNCKPPAIGRTVREIRLGAARQHVDAVFIYEVFARSGQTSNPLAVTKVVLIGFFLAPSENLEADGHAQGVLVDVRNGYSHGFASAVAEDAAFTLATSTNSDTATLSVQEKAKTAAAIELAGEAGVMLRDLRIELAEKRAAKAQEAGD
jgi:hypothetical protein